MPNNAKSSAGPEIRGESMPFEEALKKLEGIVEAMENGDLPLEQLLARFEEGTRLVQVCQAKLEQAELKIQKLEKDASGQVTLRPLAGQPATSEE